MKNILKYFNQIYSKDFLVDGKNSKTVSDNNINQTEDNKTELKIGKTIINISEINDSLNKLENIARAESNAKGIDYNENLKKRFNNSIPNDDDYQTWFEKISDNEINIFYPTSGIYFNFPYKDVLSIVHDEVIKAFRGKKSIEKLASILYWIAEDKLELKGKYTTNNILMDWHCISTTELSTIHNNSLLFKTENFAIESLENHGKAVYYVIYNTHSLYYCEWCEVNQGTILRQIPLNNVINFHNDNLEEFGIKDEFTQKAIWIGKNNAGKNTDKWMITAPSHPGCQCELKRINPTVQSYDKRTKTLRYKPMINLDHFVSPEFLECRKRDEEEIDKIQAVMDADRKKGIYKPIRDYNPYNAKNVGYDSDEGRLIDIRGNTYREVPANKYNEELDKWRTNRDLPIPVAMNSADHRRMFGN